MKNANVKTASELSTLEDIKYLITPFNNSGAEMINNNKISQFRASEVLLRAYNNTLTHEDKIYIVRNLISNSYFRHAIPVMGVKFDFSPFLKMFWVENNSEDYSQIQKFYAIDIESLKSFLCETYDYDEEELTIVEVPQ